jgi:hypothetical protein
VDKTRRDDVYISPSKGRAVRREVAKVRQEVLSEFSCGEKVDRTEGSHTRMYAKIFIKDLVAEHNRSEGAHLQLHAPVCVGHQFSHGRTLACFSTPFLLLNAARGVNDGWPSQLHFDSTGGISDSKLDVLCITTNSLRNKSNLVCLCIANQEESYRKWCSTPFHTSVQMRTNILTTLLKLKSHSTCCSQSRRSGVDMEFLSAAVPISWVQHVVPTEYFWQ